MDENKNEMDLEQVPTEMFEEEQEQAAQEAQETQVAVQETTSEEDVSQTQVQQEDEAEQVAAADASAQDDAQAQELQETPPAESKPAAPAKSSKKVVIIIIAAVAAVALIVGGVFLARTLINKRANISTTLEDGTPTPDSPEGMQQGHGESAEVVTGEAATEGAEVKNADAIETITALSDEQLGLKKADYSFMVAQQGYVISGEKYVQVIAAEKKENGDGTFSITPHGKYYISFDGKTILKEDMNAPGKYEKIK